jgi:hypothetical protein
LDKHRVLVAESRRFDLLHDLPEGVLENAVKEQWRNIFGKNSEFFEEKAPISSKSGRKRFPDGYVVTLSDPPSWYVVEVELAKHGVDHIRNQIEDFARYVENEQTKGKLIKSMKDQVKLKGDFERSIRSKYGEVHEFLYDAIHSQPTILVIIDKLTQDIEDALARKASEGIKYIRLEVFQDQSSGAKAYVLEPLGQGPNANRRTGATSEYERTGHTGKHPKKIAIAGRRYPVVTWRDVLYKTLDRVRDEHPSELNKLLELGGTKRPYFSKNPGGLRDPKKIDAVNIYMETNLNANSIMRLCERILELFGMSSRIELIED